MQPAVEVGNLVAAVQDDSSDVHVGVGGPESFEASPRGSRHRLPALDLEGEDPAIPQLDEQVDLETVLIAEMEENLEIPSPGRGGFRPGV